MTPAGTRIRLEASIGTDGAPDVARTAAEAERSVRWFPLVPLLWRLVSLPIVVFITAPALTGHMPMLVTVALILGLANLSLVVLITTERAPGLLTSRLLFATDLLVTASFFMWTAKAESPGAILRPDADGVWTYVFGTVPLWMAARGTKSGLAVLAGAIGLLYLGLLAGGGSLGPDNSLLFLDHVLLVCTPAGYAALVMRMARRGARRTVTESERAGRQAERVVLLTGLRHHALDSLEAIERTISTSVTPGEQVSALHEARRMVAATAASLRAALRSDHDTTPNPVAGSLTSIDV